MPATLATLIELSALQDEEEQMPTGTLSSSLRYSPIVPADNATTSSSGSGSEGGGSTVRKGDNAERSTYASILARKHMQAKRGLRTADQQAMADTLVSTYLDSNGRRKAPSNAERRRQAQKGRKKIRVNFTDIPLASQRSGAAIAGYVAPDDTASLNAEHKGRARQLHKIAGLLEHKLKEPSFLEACFDLGINTQDLKPKPREAFATATDHPGGEPLPLRMQQLRFDDFEHHRLHLLQLVVAQEEVVVDEKEREKRAEKHAADRLKQELEAKMKLSKRHVAHTKEKHARIRTILEKENEELRARIDWGAERATEAAKRAALVKQRRQTKRMNLKLDAETKDKAARRRQTEQEARAEARRNRFREQQRRKEARHQEMRKAKVQADEERRQKEEERAHHAREDVARAARRAEHQRDMTNQLRQAKDTHAAAVKRAHNQRRAQYYVELRVHEAARKRRADRHRKAAENRRQKAIARRAKKDKHRQQLQEIREAVAEKQREHIKQEQIATDKWREARLVERHVTPGPGQYQLPDTFKTASQGGQFSTGRRELDLDWDSKLPCKTRPTPSIPGTLVRSATSSGRSMRSAGSAFTVKGDANFAGQAASRPGTAKQSTAWET